MRAGRLDRLIDIQRRTVTPSESGEPVETWTTLDSRREASIWTPQHGDESFQNPQLVAREKVEWLIRYSSNVADLSVLDRIVYPAMSADSPAADAPENNIYDIVSVHEYGRREGLRIITARRPDVTA